MYQVFENNKPCDTTGYPQLKGGGWKNSKFDTLAEAQAYANDRLGIYGPCMLAPNQPCEFDGYGDVIEIREVK